MNGNCDREIFFFNFGTYLGLGLGALVSSEVFSIYMLREED
jgi:hypothetical protein